MKFQSILSPDAEADFDSASRCYLHIDIDLAFRFRRETIATNRRIKAFPYQFPLIEGIARRAFVKRFPYSIYFDLNDDEASVIAVVHQRRSDIIWMDRAK
jgi:toxin ParE1/3/4